MMKPTVNTILKCLLFAPCLLWPITHAQAAIWSVEDIVPSKYFEDFYPRAIAVEGSGRVHLAYGGKHLYYASYDGTGWQYQTIDAAARVGRYASIALDSQNKIHIAYYDEQNNDLKYATNSSGTWTIQTLDRTGEVGRFASLAVDSNDYVHISYYDGSTNHLKYAANAAGSWSYETVDNAIGVGRYTSIAIDSNSRIYISYADDANNDLKIAWNEGSGWNPETVDNSGEVGTFSCIAVDDDDTVHISYYDQTNTNLKYATNSSGSWSTEVVDADSAGPYSSIAVDPDDQIHIGYHAETLVKKEKIDPDTGDPMEVPVPFHTLRYATKTGGTWHPEDIEVSEENSGRLGSCVSLAAPTSEDVYISYLGEDDALRYAHYGIVLPNPSPTWRKETVEERSLIGAAASLAKDQDDALHLACVDVSSNQLVYTNNRQGGWLAPEVVDDVGSGIEATGIAVDPDNKAHISYFGSSEVLRYAKHYKDTSTIPALPWTLESVDRVNIDDTLGRYSSMTIDNNDFLHIAYHHQTDGDLWYATNAPSGAWNVEIVDDSGYVGKYPAIALDSSGYVHIAYLYEYFSINSAKNLRYATNAPSGAWNVEIVDDSGYVGEYADLAVDSSDTVHISYFDLSSGRLKYAYGSAGAWTIDVVDSDGYMGMHTSIAVDSNDCVHISYHGWTSDLLLSCLRYANNHGGTWKHQTINTGGTVGTYTSLVIDSQDKVHIAYFDEDNGTPRYAAAVYLDVDVSPAAHDFGELQVGQRSVEREITIANAGVAAQCINAVHLSDSTNFELDVAGGLTPCGSTSPCLTVSRDACTVTVTFTPKTSGEHTGTLTIDFTDPAVPDAAVTLTGKAPEAEAGNGEEEEEAEDEEGAEEGSEDEAEDEGEGGGEEQEGGGEDDGDDGGGGGGACFISTMSSHLRNK